MANKYNCNNIALLLQRKVPRLNTLSELYKEMVKRPVLRIDVEQRNNNIIDRKKRPTTHNKKDLLGAPTIYMSIEHSRVSIITDHIFSEY